MRLVAKTDDCKYAGRRMKIGEEFTIPDHDAEAARLLKGFGKARDAEGSSQEDAEPAGDVDALRSRYRTMTGRDPDLRWGVGRLQRETAGTGTYNRRDMRAED